MIKINLMFETPEEIDTKIAVVRVKDANAASRRYYHSPTGKETRAARPPRVHKNPVKPKQLSKRLLPGAREAELARERERYQNDDNKRRALMWITAAEYKALLKAQGGVCAICKKPPKKHRLHVDHDHATGKVRGLLCVRCNAWLIAAMESPLMPAALAYLAKHASPDASAPSYKPISRMPSCSASRDGASVEPAAPAAPSTNESSGAGAPLFSGASLLVPSVAEVADDCNAQSDANP
jgi:hypothetical protein